MKRRKRIEVFWYILLSTMFLASGCSLFSDSATQEFVTYIAENLEDADSFFQENQLEAFIEEEEEKERLVISTASDVKFSYESTWDGDSLSEIECRVSYEKHGENYTGTLTMYQIEDEIMEVIVEDDEVGMVGVKYRLPEFNEVVPDWGDYMEAELEVERWMSKEEMASLYKEGKEMEQLLVEYCETNKE